MFTTGLGKKNKSIIIILHSVMRKFKTKEKGTFNFYINAVFLKYFNDNFVLEYRVREPMLKETTPGIGWFFCWGYFFTQMNS